MDNEFRATLNASGIHGGFKLSDGETFEFPDSIRLDFNFQEANAKNIIKRVELNENINTEFLEKLISLLGKTKIINKNEF